MRICKYFDHTLEDVLAMHLMALVEMQRFPNLKTLRFVSLFGTVRVACSNAKSRLGFIKRESILRADSACQVLEAPFRTTTTNPLREKGPKADQMTAGHIHLFTLPACRTAASWRLA